MIRNPILCHHSGNPDVEALAGEDAWNVRRRLDLLKEAAHSGIGTRDLERCSCSQDMSAEWTTQRGPAKANVDKGTFCKLISLRALDM